MKAIFIDRDGVINKDPGGWTKFDYVTDWSEFQFLPRAVEALRLLRQSGIKVVITSNQAGVNKGYFSKDKLEEIDRRMRAEIEKRGGEIKESFYCIHTSADNCGCRKPNIGLIKEAAERYGVDPEDTYFIGDSEVDVIAGKNSGIKTMLVLSGKTSADMIKGWKIKPDYIFKDILEAVKWLLENRGNLNK